MEHPLHICIPQGGRGQCWGSVQGGISVQGAKRETGPCPTVPWAVGMSWAGWEGPTVPAMCPPFCAKQTCPHQDTEVPAGSLGTCSWRERFWLGVQRNSSHTSISCPTLLPLGICPLLSQAATQTYFNAEENRSRAYGSVASL